MRNSWYTAALLLTTCALLVLALVLALSEIREYNQDPPQRPVIPARRPDRQTPAPRQDQEGAEPEVTTGSPTEVLQQFVSAQGEGDTETMMKLYSRAQRQQLAAELGGSEQDLQRAIELLRQRAPRELEVIDQQIEDDRATLEVGVVIEGSATTGSVVLVQQNGWKVDQISWQTPGAP